MSNALAVRLAHFRRPIERLLPSEWIEAHVRLPPGKKESVPGPVRFDKSPFLREIIDCVATPGVQDVVAVMPTRMGKTLALRCWWAYSMAEDPASMILFDATIDKGRALVEDELQPLVEFNPVLRDLKPRNRHHFTAAKMVFPGATFRVYGGNSIAGAAGDTCRILLANEVEKWKGEQRGEASMPELVRHRTESFEHDRKHYFSSTPSSESGVIWQEYLKGDQRRYFVPCPCCGHMQQLAWEQVRWDTSARRDAGDWDAERVRASARYHCAAPDCAAPWDDAMRRTAIEDPRHEWRATAAPLVGGTRSYAVNGLYGFLAVHDIGALAADFLASRTDAFFDTRKDFWNSRMGMPWTERISTFDGSRIRERITEYARGTLPAGFRADVVIIGYDVQTYGFPWVVLAFNWAGECRTVDHGQAANWSDLDDLQKTYHPLAGRSFVIGDINFEARRVECCEAVFMRQNKGWLVADGQMHTSTLVKQATMNPFMGSNKGHQSANASIPRLIISTYDFKLEWEKRFTGEVASWRTYAVPEAAEKNPHDEQAEYFAQLLDERRVARKRRLAGQPEWEWKSRNGNNHAFDCHVYALALFWLLSRARTAAEKAASAHTPASTGRTTMTISR